MISKIQLIRVGFYYLLDLLYISYIYKVLYLFLFQKWITDISINDGKDKSIINSIKLNYFYYVNEVHTLTELKKYIGNESMISFLTPTLKKIEIDIEKELINGEDIFLDSVDFHELITE